MIVADTIGQLHPFGHTTFNDLISNLPTAIILHPKCQRDYRQCRFWNR